MSTTIIRYSDEDLMEFKALIDEKMATAKQELEFMKEQIMEMNENASEKQGGNWFDDSSVHTELEMLNNMVIRQQQFVSNLENALIRIQNKTYGICMVTGQEKEKKRLIEYVKNQEEHHKTKTFKEEFIELLLEHEIEFNEKYLL